MQTMRVRFLPGQPINKMTRQEDNRLTRELFDRNVEFLMNNIEPGRITREALSSSTQDLTRELLDSVIGSIGNEGIASYVKFDTSWYDFQIDTKNKSKEKLYNCGKCMDQGIITEEKSFSNKEKGIYKDSVSIKDCTYGGGGRMNQLDKNVTIQSRQLNRSQLNGLTLQFKNIQDKSFKALKENGKVKLSININSSLLEKIF